MAWDDTQTTTDEITYTEWNSMVSYIKSIISSSGVVTITAAVNQQSLVFDLPAHAGLPDPTYTHTESILWQGGETKFGKWRQTFNGYEAGWQLTYNTAWQYEDNSWAGRDSGNAAANICAYARINVAEGNSGQNSFEIRFAPPGSAGVVPDWPAGASYNFYSGDFLTSTPAMFSMVSPSDMDCIIRMRPNDTVAPMRINIRADGVNEVVVFERVTAYTSPVDDTTRVPVLTFDFSTADYTATFGGTVLVPGEILHDGNTDTGIYFDTDMIRFKINDSLGFFDFWKTPESSITRTTTPVISVNADMKLAASGTNGGGLLLYDVSATNSRYSGEAVSWATAGENLVFGYLVYFKFSDTRWWKADGDAEATAGNVLLGIALGTINTGQTGHVFLKGTVTNTTWNWSAGPIYVSTTAGSLTQTAPSGTGDVVRIVGYAITADIMFFCPDTSYVTVV